VGVKTWIEGWPVYRQVTGTDPLGRGRAAQSPKHADMHPRTATADRVARSVCPYCAVGCGQKIFVKDEEVIQI
jgi:formate dehydrogenase major subunit